MSFNEGVRMRKDPLTGRDIAVALCLLRGAITPLRTTMAERMTIGAYSTRSTGIKGPPG
jgi:hypothetical protein